MRKILISFIVILTLLCAAHAGQLGEDTLSTIDFWGEPIFEMNIDSVKAQPQKYIHQASIFLAEKKNIEDCIFIASLLQDTTLNTQIIALDTINSDISRLKDLYSYLTFKSSKSYNRLKRSITNKTLFIDNYNSVIVTVLSFDSYFFKYCKKHENSDAIVGETFAEAKKWLFLMLLRDKGKYQSYLKTLRKDKPYYSNMLTQYHSVSNTEEIIIKQLTKDLLNK